MIDPRWWSQPFPPTGAIASEGIRNQLGRPPVDPLTVFVRETAQNSWDARLHGQETIYRLELGNVGAGHRPNWERLLTPPAGVAEHLGVGRAVRRPDLRLLTVVDRRTKGLGGPTRADEVAPDRRDWVSFVLNVGEKRDTAHGGGTFGYGKAVLYRLSKVGTILVHTRTHGPDGALVTRLIGIALGSSFDDHGRVDTSARPFTGRHWWGDVREDHVQPLVDDDAEQVARALGLRPFAAEETGTTLVVLDPDLDGFTDVDSAASHLADTIAWQLWPILLLDRGAERMVAEVVAGGRTFPVPDPATLYPLSMFVAAHRRVRDGSATVLECLNPKRVLGRFALEKRVVVPMEPDAVSAAAAFAGVEGDPHHVCLMRSPELVVRYLEGPATASVHQSYAGVFRADDALDHVYAAAEPPTHDNWVHEQLAAPDRTFVRITFTRLREQLSIFRAPVVPPTAATNGASLGAAANYLGGLLAAAFARPDGDGGAVPDGADATTTSGVTAGTGGFGGADGRSTAGGASSGPDGGRGAAARDQVRVSTITAPHAEERGDAVVLVARYAVTGPGPARIDARLTVVTWDGREDEPPVDADRPRVRSWTTAAGTTEGDHCVVHPPDEVELVVVPVPDTATDVAVIATPFTSQTAAEGTRG